MYYNSVDGNLVGVEFIQTVLCEMLIGLNLP